MRKIVGKQTDIMLASAGSLYTLGTIPEAALRYLPGILTVIYVVVKIVISIRRERDRIADRRAQSAIIANAHRKPLKEEELEDDI